MNQEFVEMIGALGDERFSLLPATLEETPPEVSVRINPGKSGDFKVVEPFSQEEKVAWWPWGRYLPERPKFTLDPAMHQGRYYVQDASSMILAAVASRLSRRISGDLEADAGDSVPLLWLDACAAPGGKTTAAVDALPQGSLVVANEYDFQRAEILKENVAKWGNPSVVVCRGDTARFRKLPDLFDVVAVDAPCSGEGMMRKDPVARQQWTPGLVAECVSRQREILANLWETVRPGGYLVYSTCTFNTRENEETILWLIDNYDAAPVDLGLAFEGVDGPVSLNGRPRSASLPALRFIPGRARGEGLFLCVVRKPGDSEPAILSLSNPKKEKKRKGKPAKEKKPAFGELSSWLSPDCASDFSIIQRGDAVVAFPARWNPLLPQLDKSLDVIAAGAEMAQVKGKDLVPSQSLALSTILNPGFFPQADVGKEEALRYLARETVALPPSVPKGFVLLTFDGLPLGFVKNIGNRANNLYPKEWRIKNLGI